VRRAFNKATYFCPRGCNVVDDHEPPECGACGSVMTDDPSSFDDVHEAIEERGIREAEKRLRAEAVRR
jgi:hypothetical protein